MSVLIYLILSKMIITIECAPKLDDIIYDTLNLSSTKINNKIKSINDVNFTVNVTEENKTMKNIIPHKEDIVETKDKTKITQSDKYKTNTIQSDKDFKLNMTLVVAESNKEIAKPTTKARTLSILSQENDISDTDASEWLDPESFVPEIPKNNQRNLSQVLREKKECNNCAGEALATIQNEKNSTKNKFSNENLEIGPLYDDTIKTEETPKLEIPTYKNNLLKILRSVAGYPQDDQKILVDGYDYNINICRYYNTRYLCGYNKNIGEMKDSMEVEDVGNGCIIRGDRMECGYQVGPWSFDVKKKMLPLKYNEDAGKASPNIEPKQKAQTANVANPAISPDAPNVPKTPENEPDQRKQNSSKACYEQDNRIICYDVPA